jgi:2-oxoglutarate ferredoxin oxidoreductase subunit gamma
MSEGKEVSWLPSYGPEMRGGTANVTVCLADKPIGSPYISHPRALLVMNRPSLDKFGPRVKKGGLIVVNSSLVPDKVDRDDCTVIYLPAAEIAKKAGMYRAANLVMFGAYVGWSGVVDADTAVAVIEKEFARKAKFIPANVKAFKLGYEQGVKSRGGKK